MDATTASDDLDAVLRGATSVKITRPGVFEARQRSRAMPIIIESEAGALEEVRRCLAIDPRSLEYQISLMTPGDLDLNFLSGHEPLATVTYIFPGVVRWTGWAWDAKLVQGSNLAGWLVERGWKQPGP